MVSNPPGVHGAQGRWVEERRVKRGPWDPGPLQPQQLYWVCVLSVELKQQTALLPSTTHFFQIPTSSLKLANKSMEIGEGGGAPLPQGLMPGAPPNPQPSACPVGLLLEGAGRRALPSLKHSQFSSKTAGFGNGN